MVIVPGLNDGEALERSMTDLWTWGMPVCSAAVVPVGLTQFSHLYTAADGSGNGASTARQSRAVGERCAEGAERDVVLASDEMYLLAERPLPEAEPLCDFAQIENGIGAALSPRARCGTGSRTVPRLDGRRIGMSPGRRWRRSCRR